MAELREYQREGTDWLKKKERALLGDEAGLGKTAQLINAAEGKTLIVAPAMILDAGVWHDELEKWRPDLDATLVSYTSLNQREKTKKGGTSPTDWPKKEYDRRWDTIICDEAHYLKNRDTHWTMALERLAKKSHRLYLATATPIVNWAHELFMPLRLLRPEDAKPGAELGSYWRWVGRWFWVGPGEYSMYEVGKPLDDSPEGWRRFHDVNLNGLFLQRLRDDVLSDLPPLTEQVIDVKMGQKQRQLYKELKEDFLAWLDSGTEVVAWNTAAQTVKLAKAATGAESLEEGAGASAKLDYLGDLLAERPHPTLVVGHFRSSVHAAARVARKTGKRVSVVTGETPPNKRGGVVRAFQSGEVDTLVATIDTIGEGLTLTAADTVIFLEHSWRPSRNEQALRRIHRLGQERPTHAIHLWTRGTVDIRMRRVLQEKSDQAIAALRPGDLRSLV